MVPDGPSKPKCNSLKHGLCEYSLHRGSLGRRIVTSHLLCDVRLMEGHPALPEHGPAKGNLRMTDGPPTGSLPMNLGIFGPAAEYVADAAQRSVLFLDVMRQRGNAYREHAAETAPHVLEFKCELRGRRPQAGAAGQLRPGSHRAAGRRRNPSDRRPFVIVDPRAGHGPGIGGFKADSEIGMAMRGRPSLLFRRLPAGADARTDHRGHRARRSGLSRRGDRAHPQADGKPCVIGNCQAGWAVMMLAAIRPELFGPIIIAGSPLSYWAGRARPISDAL